MLEMASGCCVRSPMGTALAVREKTWEEARATQKWCACRSTWMDRGWSCGFMRHTRMEMAGRGVGCVQQKASRSRAKCHREPIRAFISEQTRVATAATR